MSNPWDDLAISLAERVPRRRSLRMFGAALAGAFFAAPGLSGAKAQTSDPCLAFCKCRNSKQQTQCLKTCRACDKKPRRVGGSCGAYFCCPAGTIACGSYCADIREDFYNCGACGRICDDPGDFEYGYCVEGGCEYACYEGAQRCNGACTYLDSDPQNCGACGNVCSGATPYCSNGVCTACSGTLCNGVCVDLYSDSYNCGACNNQCAPSETCSGGVCQGICVGC